MPRGRALGASKGYLADFTPIRTVISVNSIVAHHNLALLSVLHAPRYLASSCTN
jgi:hypothetical protein